MTRPSIAAVVPAPSMIVVLSLSMVIFLAEPRSAIVMLSSVIAEVLGDRAAAGENGDVFQHRLAAIAEAGRLHRGGLQRAAKLVDDQRGQRLALDVLGDDEQRPRQLRHLLEHRQQILHRR